MGFNFPNIRDQGWSDVFFPEFWIVLYLYLIKVVGKPSSNFIRTQWRIDPLTAGCPAF